MDWGKDLGFGLRLGYCNSTSDSDRTLEQLGDGTSILELERSTKTGPDWLSKFMSFGPADSVPGPVVTNGMRYATFPAVVIIW